MKKVLVRSAIIRVLIGVLLIASLLFSCVSSYASPAEDIRVFFNNRIPELMDKYGVPGVGIAIIKNGTLTWSGSFGYADIEKGRKISSNTIFRTESISKSVTAWGVMKLAEEGKIELDKPFITYIKSWVLSNSEYSLERITVRDLLSQRSGLSLGTIGSEYDPEGERPSLKEYLSKEVKLVNEPGKSFLYSNVGYDLLELLIEEVTGRDFSEYMETEILKPIGMNDSSFGWNNKVKDSIPQGYDLNGVSIEPYIYPTRASGGLYSTVEDIAKFVIAEMLKPDRLNRPVLQPDSIAELYVPSVKISGLYTLVSDSYGLGHFIELLPDGEKAVFHGGQGHGWMSHFHLIPEKGDGIVILTNSQRSWPLISSVLGDWAKWNNLPDIGMSKIIIGERAIWFLIVIMAIVSLSMVVHVIRRIGPSRHSFINGKRAFIINITGIGISISIFALLVWCMKQDYLFISSVFPTAYKWLGLSSLLFAASLLLRAVLPFVLSAHKYK